LRVAMTIRAEVAGALARGFPVVALESTPIAHGFPYPDNLKLAREAECLIRCEVGVTATIGVIDGAPRWASNPNSST
jgi:pseudouridylate synthase